VNRKLLTLLVPAVAGLLTAIGFSVTAQDGPGPEPPRGGASPGGSNFSTQYRLNATTLGGAGPGNPGQVLTSNGAGMAPTFEDPVAGGCAPSGDEFDVLLDDGAGGCTALGAGTVGQVLTSAGAGMTPTWEDTVSQTVSTGNVFLWTDGCTTTPTSTVTYVVTGSLVTVSLVGVSGFPCTADSTNMSTSTALPEEIRPAVRAEGPLFSGMTDNGSPATATLLIETDGTISFCRGGGCSSPGGWTASGDRAISPNILSITYPL